MVYERQFWLYNFGIKSGGRNMSKEKKFLTYNQQLRKLRDDKKIECVGAKHKPILVRSGYFNIVNGYKDPFTCGQDKEGNHIYFPNTSIEELYTLKMFDEKLRMLLLQRITQVEEEVRTLAGYKFDECNNEGTISWYDTKAYNSDSSIQNRMSTISAAYSQLSNDKSDYVQFYMKNHQQIPTWIMMKVIKFSTFIHLLRCSKKEVTHSLCELYSILDENNKPNVKLLIGSLHWMRQVRNSCAHNERIYCISERNNTGGKNSHKRITEKYLKQLPKSYLRVNENKKIIDLIVYFKYYLPNKEYKELINILYDMLAELGMNIQEKAFDRVRAQMGIKNIEHLIDLRDMEKCDIKYNKFDTI